MAELHRRPRVAFFGRTDTYLSRAGLELVLAQSELDVVSVTTGRGDSSHREDGPLHAVARQAGIPLRSYREVSREGPELDLVISFSNPVVFGRRFLQRVRCGAVNMHPAPLPAYRGCHGIEHALLNGDRRFGVTLHYCDRELDAGPLIEVRWTDIHRRDSAVELWHRIDELALEQLEDNLPRLVAAARRGERLGGFPQDPAEARYYGHDSLPEQAEIDPRWEPERVRRWVRAYQHPCRQPAFLACAGGRQRLRYLDGEVVLDAFEPWQPAATPREDP